MIQIDIWGGDLHTDLVREYAVKTWQEAAAIIEDEAEAGMLVNVLHTDFKAPADKADTALAQIIRDATP